MLREGTKERLIKETKTCFEVFKSMENPTELRKAFKQETLTSAGEWLGFKPKQRLGGLTLSREIICYHQELCCLSGGQLSRNARTCTTRGTSRDAATSSLRTGRTILPNVISILFVLTEPWRRKFLPKYTCKNTLCPCDKKHTFACFQSVHKFYLSTWTEVGKVIKSFRQPNRRRKKI